MPNWVVNKIEFLGETKDIEKIFNAIKSEENGAIDFNKIIKMPDYIYRGNLGKKEREKYGKNNWYDWRVEHWNTKWNAIDTYRENNAIYYNTAWSPATPIFEKLTEMFPNTDMVLTWADEDRGNNIGEAIYEDKGLTIFEYSGFYGNTEERNKAWEICIDLWGEDDQLELDKNGKWVYKDE